MLIVGTWTDGYSGIAARRPAAYVGRREPPAGARDEQRGLSVVLGQDRAPACQPLADGVGCRRFGAVQAGDLVGAEAVLEGQIDHRPVAQL